MKTETKQLKDAVEKLSFHDYFTSKLAGLMEESGRVTYTHDKREIWSDVLEIRGINETVILMYSDRNQEVKKIINNHLER